MNYPELSVEIFLFGSGVALLQNFYAKNRAIKPFGSSKLLSQSGKDLITRYKISKKFGDFYHEMR